MTTFYAVLPFALVCSFVGVGVGLRSLLQLRRHGTTGIVMFRDAGVGMLRDAGLVALPIVMAAQALCLWLVPGWLEPVRLPAVGRGMAYACGVALVILATGWMLAAQFDMGGSWRMGIDRETRPGLVVDGAFRVCRNPIYACMLAALLGFVLLVPTYISAGLCVLTWIGIRLQVAEEEGFLLASYGEAYRQYAQRVGRFVPGVGLLRDRQELDSPN